MGEECIKPNMHFQCHFAECIRDFGPMHVFWLFAFEQCNGMLGSLPNNQKSIEIQMMERFTLESHLYCLLSTLPPFLPEGICDKILKTTRNNNHFSILPEQFLATRFHNQSMLNIQKILISFDINNNVALSRQKIRVLAQSEKHALL